eukprot:gene11858-12002_t
MDGLESIQRLLILYGSQTGNAQDVAERISREARLMLFSPVVLPMDAYPMQHLPQERYVVFVAATTGQGDPPDNMRRFWKLLLRKSLPATALIGMQYAVFGLGDSGYVKFNVAAKKLDRRLVALGAKPLLERGLGDDQHPSGYESALDPWLQQLWVSLREQCPLPQGVTQPVLDEAAMLQLGPAKYTRVTSPDHFQDTRHIEFDIRRSGLEQYQPGDLLAVFPRTPPADVEAALVRLGLNGDALVRIEAANQAYGVGGSQQQQQQTISRAVCEAPVRAVLQEPPPRRYLFQVLSHFTSDSMQQERLRYFASAEGRDDLYRYNQRERRSLLEVLQDFSAAAPPLERLLECAPLLSPRLFSLASAPAAHPGRAAILMAVVRWVTPTKRLRKGLLSNWLASLQPAEAASDGGGCSSSGRGKQMADCADPADPDCAVHMPAANGGVHPEGQQRSQQRHHVCVPVWVERGALRLPPSHGTPLLLVGPGTGVAPFRGGDDGGSDHSVQADGASKVYVTNKLREHGELVWQLLSEGGAWVYVSGSAEKMPAGVEAAFQDVAVQHGRLTVEAAQKFVRQLELTGRYHVEAWS